MLVWGGPGASAHRGLQDTSVRNHFYIVRLLLGLYFGSLAEKYPRNSLNM